MFRLTHKFILILVLCLSLYVLSHYLLHDLRAPVTAISRWAESRDHKRTYYHNSNQLITTKTIKIQPKVLCNPLAPIAVFIHSTAKDIERRQTIRNTWLSDVKRRNISAYFAVGLSANQTIDDMLQIESHLYSDLIQFGFVDNYYNNTLKAIAILRWINNYCSSPQLILKTDDDVMVNISAVVHHLDLFKPGFSGTMFDRPSPERLVWAKWYMPYKYYPQSRYPLYLNGPAYVMTNNITQRLIAAIDNYTGYVLDIDDMFITGIMAERLGIERHNSNLIEGQECDNVCVMSSIAITYDCKTNEELALFWLKMKSSSPEYCHRLHILGQFFIAFLILISIIGVYIVAKYCRKSHTRVEYVCVQRSIKSL